MTEPRLILAALVLLPLATAALPAVAQRAPAAAAQKQPDPAFTLVNRSAQAIGEFYATPAGRTNWGQSRISRPLAAGASYAVRPTADGNCIFDLRAVYADSKPEERRGVNTCETKRVVFGETAARRFEVSNRGTSAITQIEARTAGSTHWIANKMTAGPIAPGARQEFALPPGGQCQYDLKLTFADGKAREKNAVDLCRMPAQAVQ